MVTCTGFIEPLNLECLLLNTFAGTTTIFTFIAFISIAALAAMFRMRNDVAMIMLVLFGLIFSNFIPDLYFLIIIVISIVVFATVKRIGTIR